MKLWLPKLLVTLLLCLHCSAQQQPPATATEQKDPTTQDEFYSAKQKWQLSCFMDGYKRLHPSADDATLQKVTAFVRALDSENAPKGEAHKRFLELERAGLADPALVALHAYETMGDKNYAAAAAKIGPAVEQADTECPLDMLAHMAFATAHCLRKSKDPNHLAEKMTAKGISTTLQIAAREKIPPLEQRFLLNRLSHAIEVYIDDAETQNQLAARLAGAGAKDQWLTHALIGSCEVRAAWMIRGDGFADSVTAAGWKGFALHLDRAYAHLKKAYDLEPNLPEVPTALIAIAMAGHAPKGEDPRFWFDRAVKAEFDYDEAYLAYEWALYPRWGGSYKKMIQFGRECAATKRFDTGVPFYYYDTVRSIEADIDNDGSAWRSEYDGLKEMLQAYGKNPMAAPKARTLGTQLCGIAWRTEHWTDAREMLDKLTTKLGDKFAGRVLDPDAIADFGTIAPEPADVQADILAFSSKGAPKLQDARAAIAAAKYDRAVAAATEAITITGDEPANIALATKAVAVPIIHKARFESGEKVALDFERGFPGWTPQGIWNPISSTRAVGTGTGSLLNRTRFGTKYEIEAGLTPTTPDTKKTSSAWLEIDVRTDAARRGSVRIVHTGPSLSLQVTGRTPFRMDIKQPQATDRVKVQVWGEYISVDLNGEHVWSGLTTFEQGGDPEGQLISFQSQGQARIENVTIQKLTQRPESIPPDADPKPPQKESAPKQEGGPLKRPRF
jgi:hypothetical protein